MVCHGFVIIKRFFDSKPPSCHILPEVPDQCGADIAHKMHDPQLDTSSFLLLRSKGPNTTLTSIIDSYTLLISSAGIALSFFASSASSFVPAAGLLGRISTRTSSCWTAYNESSFIDFSIDHTRVSSASSCGLARWPGGLYQSSHTLLNTNSQPHWRLTRESASSLTSD